MSIYINAKSLNNSYTDANGLEVIRTSNGWTDEDGVARGPVAKTRAVKAPVAKKSVKSPIKAPFKKTAIFKRINALIGHDDAMSAAILRFNEVERYDEVMALADADLIEFAAATAAHRAINTNDPKWHVVKNEIITRFGFRL
jgi:hypothetical protein